MRKIPVVLAALVAACSSSPTTTTPPPSTTPTTLTIAGGDGQAAAPGTALPVRPAAIVRDVSGNPVAGVTVTFTVDSGGGTLSATSATTGSDGIATAGVWTLGTGSGTNVVSAKTGTLAAVRFHAQAFGAAARPIFSDSSIGAGGGTLQYHRSGDALDGLAITVPGSAYPTATAWTVTADSSVVVPLPVGVSQVGPVLVVGNGQGFSDSLMTLTMPMSLSTTDAVAPFYYDPVTHTLEGIPLVGRTATSATLGTRHFSGDLMAEPGHEQRASLRAHSGGRFGVVDIVWVRAAAADLVGTWTTGFRVTVDNWEFINYGDYISPNGDCEGISATEMFYYYYKKAAGGALYHKYDTSLANPWDNVQGIRYAGSVQGDYADLRLGFNQELALFDEGTARGISTASLTDTWIVLTLKTTHQPVMVLLYGSGLGHAVVAYGATSDGTTTQVQFADPNAPTAGRTMTFTSGQLTAFPFSASATSSPRQVSFAIAAGVTALTPLPFLNARWLDFVDGVSGSDRYPSVVNWEWHDGVNDTWRALPDTIRTVVPAVNVRARCPDCPIKSIGADPADLVDNYILNDSGTTVLAHDPDAAFLGFGPHGYYNRAEAWSPSPGANQKYGFLDSRKFAVIFVPLSITNPGDVYFDVPQKFAAWIGGADLPRFQYVWHFGDSTADQKVVTDTTVTHKYAATGTYTISVRLLDTAGVLIGDAKTTFTVRNSVVWQITSVQSAGASVPDGVLSGPFDSTVDRDQRTGLSRLQSAPGRNYLFVTDSADCRGVVVEQFAAGDPIVYDLVPHEVKVVVAGNCDSHPQVYGGAVHFDAPGQGTLSGTVGDGVLGTAAFSAGTVTTGAGAITATMSGATLTGTLHWSEDYGGGVGTYTVQFTATQVQPAPGAGLRARLVPNRSP